MGSTESQFVTGPSQRGRGESHADGNTGKKPELPDLKRDLELGVAASCGETHYALKHSHEVWVVMVVVGGR